MSSLRPRGNKLYAKIKDVDGRWRRLATGFDKGQEGEAQAWIAAREAEVGAARRAKGGDAGPLTVRRYFVTWIGKQRHKTANDDRTRVEKHALPVIGDLELRKVTPEHLRDLIMALRDARELAPRTIRHISGVLHKLFKSAEIENLITKNPVKYEAGTLPKKLDKDPTWRAQAIYTREEIEQLISDERIPQDRRVLYALKFFTGRHSELSSLTWSQYDAAPKPLGALNLSNTKTGVPRPVPVHPTLAKILAEWKLSGWDDFYGHKPRPIDLIVPSRNGRKRTANGAQDQLVYDLGKIGLRVEAGKDRRRRGHDLRRTLITLARTDGAIDSLLRWVTHGARPNEILDQYSSPPWEALCAEVAKIKIERREGRVIAMAANNPHRPVWSSVVQASNVRESKPKKKRPRRDSNPFSSAGSDSRSQEKPTLGIARTSPNDADAPSTGPSRGPVESRCDVGFALLR